VRREFDAGQELAFFPFAANSPNPITWNQAGKLLACNLFSPREHFLLSLLWDEAGHFGVAAVLEHPRLRTEPRGIDELALPRRPWFLRVLQEINAYRPSRVLTGLLPTRRDATGFATRARPATSGFRNDVEVASPLCPPGPPICGRLEALVFDGETSAHNRIKPPVQAAFAARRHGCTPTKLLQSRVPRDDRTPVSG
jgi:hypothetical protein